MKAHGGDALDSTSRGHERDLLLSEVLERTLSPGFRFGCGQIVDASGEESGEVDIVIETPFAISLSTGTDIRLYPAESVALAIQVKSNIDRDWASGLKQCRKILDLKRQFKGGVFGDTGFDRTFVPVTLVGYRSKLSAENLIQKYEAIPMHDRPNILLVLEPPVLIMRAGATAQGPSAMVEFLGSVRSAVRTVAAGAFDLNAYQ